FVKRLGKPKRLVTPAAARANEVDDLDAEAGSANADDLHRRGIDEIAIIRATRCCGRYRYLVPNHRAYRARARPARKSSECRWTRSGCNRTRDRGSISRLSP